MKQLLIVFSILMSISSITYADNMIVPTSREQIKLSFAPLVKATSKAVVNIYIKTNFKGNKQRFNPFFNDPFFNQFFGNRGFGQMQDRVQSSLGSGVILSEDGFVVSNAHVIGNADEIVVVLSDGREFKATKILIDKKTDLAVLKISGEKFSYLKINDSDNLEVGDLVLAIGNPFGVGQTVTSGIVSALARSTIDISDFNFFIQTDAAINPGNSGGALIDMDGSLVGVNTAIFSKSGGSLGIGFAIPSNMVKAVLNAAKMGDNKLITPWTGVSGQRLSSDIAKSIGLKGTKGVLVKQVSPKGPAYKAGLKTSDVILSVNGHEIESPEGLKFRLATIGIDNQINFKIWRKFKTMDISFKSMKAPEIPKKDETKITGNNPFNNVIVANISPALNHEIDGIDKDSGVAVIGIEGFNRMGLRIADIILSINGNEIIEVKQLKEILSKNANSWQIKILRNGQVISVVIR